MKRALVVVALAAGLACDGVRVDSAVVDTGNAVGTVNASLVLHAP